MNGLSNKIRVAWRKVEGLLNAEPSQRIGKVLAWWVLILVAAIAFGPAMDFLVNDELESRVRILSAVGKGQFFPIAAAFAATGIMSLMPVYIPPRSPASGLALLTLITAVWASLLYGQVLSETMTTAEVVAWSWRLILVSWLLGAGCGVIAAFRTDPTLTRPGDTK